MESIIVQPKSVWEYFEENKGELRNEAHLIAEETQAGTQIFIEKHNEKPYICVCMDDEIIDEEYILNKQDCDRTASEMYERYIYDAMSYLLQDDWEGRDALPGITDDSIEDQLMADREIDLTTAVEDFLYTITEAEPDQCFSDDEIEDIKDHFLEFLARKYDTKIYRPMYLEADDGTDFYEEYPYEKMIFDDPGNPVYKK